MEVNFYKFSKRPNSTKSLLGVAPFFTCSATLKDGCSILTPTLKINNRSFDTIGTHITDANYVHIAAFKRHYFVTDWKFVDGLWECSLKVDVLHSWRAWIMSEKLFVTRADVPVENAAPVVDTTPIINYTHSSKSVMSQPSFFRAGYTDGFFVVGIISPGADMGSVNYYFFPTVSDFQTFTSKLLNNVDWLSVTDVSSELTKCLINPMQYITSCKFFPFATSGIASRNEAIKLGFWDLGLSGQVLTTHEINVTSDLTIPKHPQAAECGSFLNMPPYSSYTVEFDPFGAYSIDGYRVGQSNHLYFDINIDLVSGEGKLTTRADGTADNPRNVISINYSKICVDIPITSANTGFLGLAAGVIGNAISEFGGDFITNELSKTVGGVCNTIAGACSNVVTQGSQNTRAFMSGGAILNAHFQSIEKDYHKHYGRPVMTEITLQTLKDYYMKNSSGFVKCLKPYIDKAKCTDVERDEITRLLEEGVYIE